VTALDPTDPRARVVTSAAGSGKTTLLVQRYLRHLRDTTADRIVAITFTRKAAAELQERIATVLRAVLDPSTTDETTRALYLPYAPDADRARAALEALPAAPVGTVDAFVLTLLQEFLLHARLPLGGGDGVWLDGPLEPGGDAADAFAAAARDGLEALGPDAAVVLAELTLGKAIADVATLAAEDLAPVGREAELLAALGAAVGALEPERASLLRGGKPYGVSYAMHQAASGWLAAPVGDPPLPVFAWLGQIGARETELRALRRDLLADLLRRLDLPGDPTEDVWYSMKHLEWTEPTAPARADTLLGALGRLAAGARRGALEQIARTGQLGYDELLLAATELCESAPPELAGRYDVLMVDELQDTNPEQLAFYRAFAAMQRPRAKVASFFVGDSRQSIYRFRRADPYGWRRLVDEARADGTWGSQSTNYRSSAGLVDVQRATFDRLVELAEGGVDPLPGLVAAPGAAPGPLLGDTWPEPVVVVDADGSDTDADESALAAFAARLTERWAEDPEADAAVLVPTWRLGAFAVRTLRRHGLDAQLTGDRSLLASRVASDLRLWLRALVDPSDDIAVAGVLKHPSVGITDRALLALRRGPGLTSVFAAAGTADTLEDADADVLAAVRPTLVEARRAIGREPTADVLERVAAALHWRALLEAGPEGLGGRATAQLDVLLDVVRETEGRQVDPHAVLEALDPDRDSAADLPVVRLHASAQVVTVTTYYGAKGLEWDHIALLAVDGDRGSDGVRNGESFRVAHPRGVPVAGARLDPAGGLKATMGPLARLVCGLGKREKREESLRLFYVGFTRARQTVTLGLAGCESWKQDQLTRLRTVLVEEPHPSVRVITPDALGVPEARIAARPRTRRRAAFGATWPDASGWRVVRPSSRRVSGLAARYRASATLSAGARSAPPRPTEGPLANLPEIVLGDVVHGWLERWAFVGIPEVADAEAFLAEAWTVEAPEVATWLVAVGLAVRDDLPGFADLLDEDVALHFELPLVGVVGDEYIAGRADLVVELPGRRAAVIDFKAGSRVARSIDEIPGLSTYAGQLDSYRRALEGAGWEVTETGLLYARGPTWVRFGG